MRHFLSSCFCLSLLLSGSPTFAFFDEINALEQGLNGTEDTGLESIVDELDTVKSASPAFSDVDARAWYATFVSAVAKLGIVSGDKNPDGTLRGTFRPGDNVTVGEILKISFKAAGKDESKCSGSGDYRGAENHWAKSFVRCGQDLRVRLLEGETSLDRSATRAEVIGLIDDVFQEQVPPLLSTFIDTRENAYEGDIAYNAAIGVISGDTDAAGKPKGTFRPNAPINRAEVAKIIKRKLDLQ